MAIGDEQPFEVSCVRDGPHATIVVVRGELDIASAEGLSDALDSPDAQVPTVVLDLRAVTFIDSSGLSAIVARHRRADAEGGRFAVAAGGARQVQRLLELAGLDRVLELVEDPADVISPHVPGAGN